MIIINTFTDTVTPTETPINTNTITGTQTETYSYTITASPTFTLSATQTVTDAYAASPSFTATPTPYRPDKIDITVYDSTGVVIKQLPEAWDSGVIHTAALSSNPFHANGVNILTISDADGNTIGQWDGKNLSGKVVIPGVYTIRIKTTDKDGNEYVLDKNVDVISESSVSVNNFRIIYGSTSIRIRATITDADRATLRIYNMGAELVKEFAINDPGNTDIHWDKKSSSGKKAVNGLYVAVLEYRDVKTGYAGRIIEKIAVIK
jgi:flagellar hook assembly protein FlgD